jgi:hypothetical protein
MKFDLLHYLILTTQGLTWAMQPILPHGNAFHGMPGQHVQPPPLLPHPPLHDPFQEVDYSILNQPLAQHNLEMY